MHMIDEKYFSEFCNQRLQVRAIDENILHINACYTRLITTIYVILFIFTGTRPKIPKKTLVRIPIESGGKSKEWIANLKTVNANELTVEVTPPTTCFVGAWRLSGHVTYSNHMTKVTKYKEIYILFNPFHKGKHELFSLYICCIVICIYMQNTLTQSRRATQSFRRICTSHIIWKVLCVRGSWRPNRTATYWPPLLWPSVFLSRSPGCCSTRSLGAHSAGCWLPLPHLVTNGSGFQTNWLPVFTELYNSSIAHSISPHDWPSGCLTSAVLGMACLIVIKRK